MFWAGVKEGEGSKPSIQYNFYMYNFTDLSYVLCNIVNLTEYGLYCYQFELFYRHFKFQELLWFSLKLSRQIFKKDDCY